jgi:hypothetical protein
MEILYCALGAFFTVELVKTVSVRPLRPWMKLLVALASAIGIALIISPQHRVGSPLWLGVMAGAAGLAVVIHRFARTVRVIGDWLIRDIIQKGRQR